MELLEIMQNRRSVRSYTDEKVSEENLLKILQAGMLVASGKAIYPWEMIVVRDKEMLRKMSNFRAGTVKMLLEADVAIVVIANTKASDIWVEDCSSSITHMHLMADSLGVGSCWVQGRQRPSDDGRMAEEYLRELLKFPEDYALEGLVTLGMPKARPNRRELSDLPMNKVHYETF